MIIRNDGWGLLIVKLHDLEALLQSSDKQTTRVLCLFLFLFLVVLGLELRALHLLGRHSTP
jgi:hypothetical protein